MARLKQAPVFFTLAQMRFNAVPDMAATMPGLVDAFRSAGYPDYEVQTARTVEFQPAPDGLRVNPRQFDRHRFSNLSRTKAFVLDNAALTYETTDYPIFTQFAAAFLDALNIVHELRPIAYADRLGMRMLDAVQPRQAETLDQYVVREALGVVCVLDEAGQLDQALTESILRIGTRSLLLRTIRVPKGIVIPPDLAPIHLNIRDGFLSHSGETMVLDMDCFQESRSEFSIDTIRTDLGHLKQVLAQCFTGIVTSHALEVWR